MTSEYLHPYSAYELLKLIDKARPHARRAKRAPREKENSGAYSLTPAYDFFVSTNFENGLKRLKKAYRTEELDALRTAIVELSTTGKISDRTAASSDESGINECELSSRGYRLIYGKLPGVHRFMISIKPPNQCS